MSLYRIWSRREMMAAKVAVLRDLGVAAPQEIRDGIYHLSVPDSVPLADADRIVRAAAPSAQRVPPHTA